MKIITLLRNPLDGNVAENTLKHGCGGINIEVCRVPTSDDLNGGVYRGVAHPERHAGLFTGLRGRLLGEYQQPTGRWPANFILTHSDGCVLKGTKTIKENTATGTSKTTIFGGKGSREITHHADENGEAKIADWACVDGCPIKEMDTQSGDASRYFMQFRKEDQGSK